MRGAVHNNIATLRLHIDRHVSLPPRGRPNVPHRVFAHDETGEIQLVYFRAQGGWVEKLLPVGEDRFVSGTIGFFNGEKQITHPDYVVEVDKFEDMPLVEPVYPLTHGLASARPDQARSARSSAPCPSCPSGCRPSASPSSAGPPSRPP